MQVPFGHQGAMVSRSQPLHAPTAYKTYGMSMPLSSHWRKATCAEIWCEHWRHGWVTIVDLSDSDGRERAQFIMADSERKHTVARTGLNTFEFTFPAGQRCYLSGRHMLPLDKQPLLYVRPGDFRAKTGETRWHSRTEDWVEDSQQSLDRIRTRAERG
jgi:hypothetical protein